MRERLRIAAVLFAGQVLGRGAQAVYVVLVARAVSPRDFGNFAATLALGTIVATLADLGFARLIIKDTARQQDVALVPEMLRVRAVGVLVASLAFGILGVAGLAYGAWPLVLWSVIFVGAEGLSYGYEA